MQQNTTKDSRYSHGKIYKLIDNTTGYFYIGHTSLKRLDQRFGYHKQDCKRECKKNMKIYQNFTHDKFCSGDIKIILIEEINVSNKNELQKIENDYIQREIGNILCLNTNMAVHDPVYKIKYNQKYAKQNADTIYLQRKQYREDNQAQIAERKQALYKLNRDDILAKGREKTECECGSRFNLSAKARHIMSTKHQNWVNGIRREESLLFDCQCGKKEITKIHKSRHEQCKQHQQWLKSQAETKTE